MTRLHLALASSIALCAGFTANTFADEVLFESIKITAPDGAPFDAFGRSVAVESNTVLVGAPLDDDGGRSDSGSAYLFNANSGAFANKLRFSVPRSSGLFGNSVAVFGGVALVGTPNAFNTGAASRFINGQENLLRPFSSENASPEISNFGFSVDLSADGTTTAIGARSDTGEPDAGANGGGGAMYLYTSDGGVKKIFASDASFADNFGTSVATTSSFAVASSPFDDDNGAQSGSIYVFDVASGTETYKIVPADTTTNDLFGLQVAAAGSVIAASAPRHDQNGIDSGAVYLFDAIDGTQLNKITVPGSSVFGTAIALDNNHLVAAGREGVYVYDIATGDRVAELRQSNPAPGDFFGAALALDGDTIVVSAEGDATNGERAGAVYVYSLSGGNNEPVDPPPTTEATTVAVQSIDAGVYTFINRRGREREGAEVTVTLADNLGDPVEGATVTVRLSGRLRETVSGITDINGSVVLQSERTRRARRNVLNYTATVVEVSSSLDYDPDSNVVSSASSRSR